jgi:hypothetical protein
VQLLILPCFCSNKGYNTPMIYNPDQPRGALLQRYKHKGSAIGRAGKWTAAIITSWAEAGRSTLVIWGPPGCGKSTILSAFDLPYLLVVETTGLNRNINKALRQIPKPLIHYVVLLPQYVVCRDRLIARSSHPMGDSRSLVGLLQKWFDKAFVSLESMLPVDIIVEA